MTEQYVVSLRQRLFGPFASREQADKWAAEYARTVTYLRDIVTWEVRPLRSPDVSS